MVLKMEGLAGVSWGRAEELRQAVLRLRARGQEGAWPCSYSCEDNGYLVASAADEIYALPESTRWSSTVWRRR